MEPWLLVLVAPFVGSFLGLLVIRLPAGDDVVWQPSHCRLCKERLGFVDLIPIASWVISRGRCRRCGAAIDPRHPIAEGLATLVALVAVLWLPAGQALWACGLGWALVPAAMIDFDHLLLPDALVLPLIPAGVVWHFVLGLDPAVAVLGAFVGFLSFLGIELFYARLRGRPGLGRGDAKLFAAAGAWLGWVWLPTVAAFAASLSLLAVIGWRLWYHGDAFGLQAEVPVPFGPGLAAAIWLVFLMNQAEATIRFGT